MREKTCRLGTPPPSDGIKANILTKAAIETPSSPTHLSVRMMAEAMEMLHTGVRRIRSEIGIKPGLVKTFKISVVPQFEKKFTDAVKMHYEPTGQGAPDERGQDWQTPVALSRQRVIQFPRKIDRATTKDLDLHLMLDNCAIHKKPQLRAWPVKDPCFHLRFTLKGASLMSLVERFFAEITNKCTRRGVFKSVGELEDAIGDCLDWHNVDPKPFQWPKTAKTILDQKARTKDNWIGSGYRSESES